MASTTPRKESEKIEGIVNSDSLLQIESVGLNGLGALHPTNLNELGGAWRAFERAKTDLKEALTFHGCASRSRKSAVRDIFHFPAQRSEPCDGWASIMVTGSHGTALSLRTAGEHAFSAIPLAQ